jgi:hypothetical protein
MHHPAAQHFQPFAVFTHHVNFRRRFGEREVGRTETNLQIFKEVVQEIVQRPFRLVKLMFLSTIRPSIWWNIGVWVWIVVVTIDAARRDNADRRLLVFHGADLHAGGLRTQQARGIKPESVVVSACRMMAGIFSASKLW